jgi:amino acid transporter
VRFDWRRLRAAEGLVAIAAAALAVSLFLPWFEFAGGQEDAWQALTVTEIPAALAALVAFALVLATLTQRSPAIPLALAVWTATLSGLASVVIAVRAIAPPDGAYERCYGLWIALAASILLFGTAIGSLHDERPYGRAPVMR